MDGAALDGCSCLCAKDRHPQTFCLQPPKELMTLSVTTREAASPSHHCQDMTSAVQSITKHSDFDEHSVCDRFLRSVRDRRSLISRGWGGRHREPTTPRLSTCLILPCINVSDSDAVSGIDSVQYDIDFPYFKHLGVVSH